MIVQFILIFIKIFMCSLLELPNELLEQITSHLPTNSLFTLGGTCQLLRQICLNSFLRQYKEFTPETTLKIYHAQRKRTIRVSALVLLWVRLYRSPLPNTVAINFLEKDLHYKANFQRLSLVFETEFTGEKKSKIYMSCLSGLEKRAVTVQGMPSHMSIGREDTDSLLFMYDTIGHSVLSEINQKEIKELLNMKNWRTLLWLMKTLPDKAASKRFIGHYLRECGVMRRDRKRPLTDEDLDYVPTNSKRVAKSSRRP